MDDPRLASSRLHADIARLAAQVNLSWPREAIQLARLGLQDGMSILEVGSGPGFVTQRLLDSLPQSTVTAVELDPSMCALARARLAGYLGQRLEIVETSILAPDLPEDNFDFALARYVFQHLSAPDFAAAEIFRMLKPGGRLVIADIDDDLGGLLAPNMPAFAQIARKVRQVQASAAGDRHIGRKLWRLLAHAGYVQLSLDAIVFHSDDLGLAAFLPQYDPERYRPLVVSGALSTAEWEGYRQAYEQFLAAPDPLILQVIMLASGMKP